MTLRELAKRGKEELVVKALAGELRPEHVWLAMKGAATYQQAVARGDVASDADAQARMDDRCGLCLSMTHSKPVGNGGVKLWCGPALEDHEGADLPTCGCLVGITMDGVAYAGGKLCVATEACPQGKWGSVRAATIG